TYLLSLRHGAHDRARARSERLHRRHHRIITQLDGRPGVPMAYKVTAGVAGASQSRRTPPIRRTRHDRRSRLESRPPGWRGRRRGRRGRGRGRGVASTSQRHEVDRAARGAARFSEVNLIADPLYGYIEITKDRPGEASER